MKKTLVIVAAMIAPMMAQAGMNVSVRSDYVNTMEYKNTSNVKGGASSLFVPSYARLNGTGKVGDADVKMGLDLLNMTEGLAAGTTPINHLYISKNHDAFTFTAGKLETPNGGFERVAIDSGDAYLVSLANGGDVVDGGAATAVAPVVSLQNTSGFGIGFGGDHKVTFQTLNEQSAGSAATVPDKRHSYGVGYAGAFGDWAAKAAYYIGATENAGVNTKENYMNAGVSGNIAGFGMTFDYIMNSSEGRAANSNKAETSSLVALFGYDMGMYKPQLKVESSTHKTGAAVANGNMDRMGIAAALEVKPSDDDFRYHVAYVMTNDKYKQTALANDKVDAAQLIVGLKYTGDLLK